MHIPGPLHVGKFVARPNRFLSILALVGTQVEALLPDPGPSTDLLLPARPVWVLPVAPPHARPPHTTPGHRHTEPNPPAHAARALALSRQHWLFLGSARGGHSAAIHFSLIASAKRHNLDPFAYLRDLLQRIPTHLNQKIQDLLPDRWKTLED